MAPGRLDKSGLSFEFKIADKDWEKVLKATDFQYIDDTMDTSNRPVVDLSDHTVDSLYPNIVDIKT